MGWGVGVRFKREGGYVYFWLIHSVVWLKPTQHCKAIIFQLQEEEKKVHGLAMLIPSIAIFRCFVFSSHSYPHKNNQM